MPIITIQVIIHLIGIKIKIHAQATRLVVIGVGWEDGDRTACSRVGWGCGIVGKNGSIATVW